jgi:hypothetical protein
MLSALQKPMLAQEKALRRNNEAICMANPGRANVKVPVEKRTSM